MPKFWVATLPRQEHCLLGVRQCYASIEGEHEPNNPNTASATGVKTCALRQLNMASDRVIARATHIMCTNSYQWAFYVTFIGACIIFKSCASTGIA